MGCLVTLSIIRPLINLIHKHFIDELKEIVCNLSVMVLIIPFRIIFQHFVT